MKEVFVVKRWVYDESEGEAIYHTTLLGAFSTFDKAKAYILSFNPTEDDPILDYSDTHEEDKVIKNEEIKTYEKCPTYIQRCFYVGDTYFSLETLT